MSPKVVPRSGTTRQRLPISSRLAAGVVVRDRYPEVFLDVHEALFSARHDDGRDLREPEVVRDVLDSAGAPADQVMAELEAGWAHKEVRTAHEKSVNDLAVFGVPTFIVGEQAVFVRLMTRPGSDVELARSTIEGTVGLIGARPDLNEFKHTKLDR